ncbi:AraC family transcriptional regulator [Flavobacterium agrisoli]|uniref:Helix-turn-helix domain-containing protein n=1 Tax=Flavobacterium agrisoli TaxID=2793066 RepID=A0A934UIT7_9FLAO|nr:AraC family transcriptional regulator [Flavobacterium agrisoli]MBK0369182.1 helix-turn-helix domain-containing protein [Flavobacterium agrisoli]
MRTTAPTLEIINHSFGNSFSYSKQEGNANLKPNNWHYHPEIELLYINEGSGKRQIGSHVSDFENGDLVLIGSNLPHCGLGNVDSSKVASSTIHIKHDFLGNEFFDKPEMKNCHNLFKQAKSGLVFTGETKISVGKKIEAMENQSPFQRLISLLTILNELEFSNEFELLNADSFSLQMQVQDNDRIDVVFNFIKDNFQEPISLEEISGMVSMTEPSFCRFFKKITNKTFTNFVNEYRLAHASKLLAEKSISINEVCYESGFNNFSHFSKLFKAYTGKSAMQYRQELKMVI